MNEELRKKIDGRRVAEKGLKEKRGEKATEGRLRVVSTLFGSHADYT